MNWSYPFNVEVWDAPLFPLMRINLTSFNLTVTAANGTNISCTLTSWPPSPYFPKRLRSVTYNWTQVNSTYTVSLSQADDRKYFYCRNTSNGLYEEYLNQLVWVVPVTPKPPGIIRVPRSCTNTSILQHKIVFHYNVTFPSLESCVRKKRAWYDTLLGGAGTGLGIVNSIDLETLASRLRSAGQDVSQALTVNAQWLPTTILPHQNTLQYQGQFLQVFNNSILVNLHLMKNIVFYLIGLNVPCKTYIPSYRRKMPKDYYRKVTLTYGTIYLTCQMYGKSKNLRMLDALHFGALELLYSTKLKLGLLCVNFM
ncbi:uncharacterized protein LOC144456956 isoform X1 [Phascolarctos cinereus]